MIAGLRHLPLGAYLPRDSVVHALDPRGKFLFLLVFAALALSARSAVDFAVLYGAVVGAAGLARIPLAYLVRGLRPVLWFLAFTAALHALTTRQGAVLWAWGPLAVTEGGLRAAGVVALRVLLLVAASSLLTLTTSPLALTDGFARLMAPLRRFGVPVAELALMMSVALRFVPTLLEEAERIARAQAARGADFTTGPLARRAQHLLALLVPLFVGAFRRAEELAVAMEARGWRGGDGRTRMRPLAWTRRDAALIPLAAALSAVVGWA